jgi:transposase
LRPTEVVAPLAFSGATDTAAFQTYVEKVLVPELRPGDVVVWDNLQPHKNAQVIQAVEAAGARVERLPPYSPDKSPIEEMFAKVKGCLRTAAARTTNTVIAALGDALRQINPGDIGGWFQDRCAYAILHATKNEAGLNVWKL